MMRFSILLLLLALVVSQKEVLFEKLHLNRKINHQLDGFWFVYAKTQLDNKECQTFNFTTDRSEILLDNHYKKNKKYISEFYVLEPQNEKEFYLNNSLTKIIYSDKDSLLLNISQTTYLLLDKEKIEDEEEHIFMQLILSLNGFLFKNFMLVNQHYC